MGTASLAETLAGANLLVAGLKANAEKLKRRGLDDAFIASLDALTKSVSTFDAEQEALKARLKEKTAQIDNAVADLKAKGAEARKIIKIELAQPAWKEFGISDAR